MAKLGEGLDRLKSGRVRWRVTVNGKAYSGTADDRVEAIRQRSEAILRAGGEPESEVTVRELVDMWKPHANHAPATVKVRDHSLARVPEAFMDRRADKVTAPIVAGLWREMEAAKVGRHVIGKARNALSRAWQHGLQHGLVSSNPIQAVRPMSSEGITINDEVIPPTVEQVRALLEAANPMMRAWVTIAATVGARPGEVCGLQWGDIGESTIFLSRGVGRDGEVTPGKNAWKRTGKGHRTVEVDRATIAVVRGIERRVGVDWVFCHENGSKWRPDWVYNQIRKLADFPPYDLRHFAASQALDAGMTLNDVAQMIGDNPATVARTYRHWVRATPPSAVGVARVLRG